MATREMFLELAAATHAYAIEINLPKKGNLCSAIASHHTLKGVAGVVYLRRAALTLRQAVSAQDQLESMR